jgi:hypothetical protein
MEGWSLGGSFSLERGSFGLLSAAVYEWWARGALVYDFLRLCVLSVIFAGGGAEGVAQTK